MSAVSMRCFLIFFRSHACRRICMSHATALVTPRGIPCPTKSQHDQVILIKSSSLLSLALPASLASVSLIRQQLILVSKTESVTMCVCMRASAFESERLSARIRAIMMGEIVFHMHTSACVRIWWVPNAHACVMCAHT